MWCFVVLSWCDRGPLWTVKYGGLPQLSPSAALDFDLLFNCSELDITHTPNLAKIFLIIFGQGIGAGCTRSKGQRDTSQSVTSPQRAGRSNLPKT